MSAAGVASSGCTNGTLSRACNSGACEPTAWLVGAWGACSKTCADKHGAGKQTRTVGCHQFPGSNASALVSRERHSMFCDSDSHCWIRLVQISMGVASKGAMWAAIRGYHFRV